MRLCWLLLLVLLGLAAPARAKTICVDPVGGSDATLYAAVGSSSSCWQTLVRAVRGSTNPATPDTAQAAQAGDLVLLLAGTHATATEIAVGAGQRLEILYNPANSGTAGNPITIKCVANFAGAPASVAGCLLTASVHEGPLFGMNNRDYIEWDGFRCDEAQMTPLPDIGCILVWQSDNATIRNWRLDGITTAWGDNHQAIRVEESTNVLISNGYAHDVADSEGGGNQPCVMFYETASAIVEKLTCEDSDTGVFIKALNTGLIEVRDSLFRGITSVAMAVAGSEHSAKWYRNIVIDSASGITWRGPIYGGAGHPVNVDVCANTFDLSGAGAGSRPINFGGNDISGWSGNRFVGNITYAGQWTIEEDGIAEATVATALGSTGSGAALIQDFNIYFGATTAFSSMASTRNFADWKTFTGADASSAETDPLFEDLAMEDYRLESGSPARAFVADVCDIDGDANTAETIDAGARQFDANGDPIQIGYSETLDEEPEPPGTVAPQYRRIRFGAVLPAPPLATVWALPRVQFVPRRRLP